MKKRKKITVEMDVTEAQAVALSAFFKSWNSLSSAGASRFVAFYADGDGNFHPQCKIDSEWNLKKREPLEILARIEPERDIERYDFDAISSAIRAANESSKELKMVVSGCHTVSPESTGTRDILAEMYLKFLDRNNIKYKYEIEESRVIFTISEISDEQRHVLEAESGIHRVVRISPFDTQNRRHTTFIRVVIDDDTSNICCNNIRSYMFVPLEYIRVHNGVNEVVFEPEEMKRILNGELNLVSEKINNESGKK